MRPPFADHPLIREFNELKRWFRKHETSVSRSRLKEFRSYVRKIQAAGTDVAFDFVGSLNFGQSLDTSDADVVIYVRCPEKCTKRCPDGCDTRANVKAEMLSILKYDVQVIDSINLTSLDRALERGKPANLLLRFAFYRSICRLVNAQLMRPYHSRLLANRELLSTMQPQLAELFDGLCATSGHQLSFRKYQERLGETGIRLPGVLRAILRRHQEEGNLYPLEGASSD